MKTYYQLSSHPTGAYSVQVFDAAGNLLQESDVVKDVNGWRVVVIRPDGYSTDGPQHATPEAAGEWYSNIVGIGIEDVPA